MNKIFKTILIVLALMPLAPLSLAYANGNLVVEFETGNAPLFNEANFLPGEGVSRWVKVTNNSGQAQRIATQPLNITDLNRLGDVLNLEIKEGGVVRYNNALSTFFAGGENYLSDLANGATSQYDFTISFYSGSQNTFQGKSLGFDILIGFQGTEGGILPGAGSTSGYGGGSNGPPGGLPPGLTIQNEAAATTTVDSVTIAWTTSYSATSQVIYALENEKHILDLTDTAGSPPKYGYERTTPESDAPANLNGALSHSITILGLTSGTTYYYRAVSHGSLAISAEHSFTTLTSEEAAAIKKETKEQIAVRYEEGAGAEAEYEKEEEKGADEGIVESLESEYSGHKEEQDNTSKNWPSRFAAALGLSDINPYTLLLVILILFLVISLVVLNKKRSKI